MSLITWQVRGAAATSRLPSNISSKILAPCRWQSPGYWFGPRASLRSTSNRVACFATSPQASSPPPKARATSPSRNLDDRRTLAGASLLNRVINIIPAETKEDSKIEDSLVFLRQRTTGLLDTPMGSWTPKQWRECVELIHQWTPPTLLKEKGTTHDAIRSKEAKETADEVTGTAESVTSSFSLLERLLAEYRRGPNALVALELLHTSLLESVVHNWAICWEDLHPSSSNNKRHQTKSHSQHDDVTEAEQKANVLLCYSPENILGRIVGYQARSKDMLMPSRFIYQRLVKAAATSRTPNIAVKVLDQMAPSQTHEKSDNTGVATPQQKTEARKDIELDRDLYLNFIRSFSKHGDPEQAEAVLEHMYEQFVKTGSAALMPTTDEFNLVLIAWTAGLNGSKYASERCQAILRRMDKLSAPGGELEGIASPDPMSYSIVMKSLSQWLETVIAHDCGNAMDYWYVGELADSLMNELEKRYQQGDARLRPDVANYNSLLRIWSQLGNPEGAESVLERMYEDFTVKKNRRAKPQVASFNYVLISWLNKQKIKHTGSEVRGSGQANEPSSFIGERAEAILRKLQDVHRSGALLGVKPTGESRLVVLHCWAETRAKEAGDRALAILEEIRAEEKKTGERILNTVYYGAVINAYANAGRAQDAESVLAEFTRQFYEEGNNAAKPTSFTISIVLNAWAKSNDAGAAERADTLLQEMKNLYQKGILDSKPSIISYSTVLECYSRSSRPGAIERAESLLAEMEQRARDGEDDLKPNVVVYRNLLHAYANKGLVEETEAALERMLEECRRGNIDTPPVRVANLVLTAISKSNLPDAATRAVEQVKRIEKMFENQKLVDPPDVVSYTLAMKCISNCQNTKNRIKAELAEKLLDEMEHRSSQGETFLAPNTMTYSTVIKILAQCGRPEQAEALLERMYQKYKDGNSGAAPNSRTFTSVLHAWSRSALVGTQPAKDRAVERVLAILEWMKELHRNGVLPDILPNAYTYGTALGTLALSNKKDACQHALGILDEMEKLAEDGDPVLTPTAICYNFALETFANVGDGLGAQKVLARMYHKHESGKLVCKPSTKSWTSVVMAWCQSKGDQEKVAVRIEAVLKRMKELYDDGVLQERPEAQTYVQVLRFFSKSRHGGLRQTIDPLLNHLDALILTGNKRLSMRDHLAIIRALCSLPEQDEFLSRAEGILRRMLEERDPSSPRWNAKAVRSSFGALIDAGFKSQDQKSRDRARRLKRELQELNLY